MKSPRNIWFATVALFSFACSNEVSVSVAGRITTLIGGQPQVGVTVCDGAESTCASTDSDGNYSLQFETTQAAHLLADLPDHRGAVIPFEANTEVITLRPVSLSPMALIDTLFSTAGLDEVSDTGVVAFSISNGLAGDGINIPDVVIRVPGEGEVIYSGAMGLPDVTLTQTSDNGGGVIANVPEGEVTVFFDALPTTGALGQPVNCYGLLGHGETVEAVSTPILSERVSVIRIECVED